MSLDLHFPLKGYYLNKHIFIVFRGARGCHVPFCFSHVRQQRASLQAGCSHGAASGPGRPSTAPAQRRGGEPAGSRTPEAWADRRSRRDSRYHGHRAHRSAEGRADPARVNAPGSRLWEPALPGPVGRHGAGQAAAPCTGPRRGGRLGAARPAAGTERGLPPRPAKCAARALPPTPPNTPSPPLGPAPPAPRAPRSPGRGAFAISGLPAPGQAVAGRVSCSPAGPSRRAGTPRPAAPSAPGGGPAPPTRLRRRETRPGGAAVPCRAAPFPPAAHPPPLKAQRAARESPGDAAARRRPWRAMGEARAEARPRDSPSPPAHRARPAAARSRSPRCPQPARPAALRRRLSLPPCPRPPGVTFALLPAAERPGAGRRLRASVAAAAPAAQTAPAGGWAGFNRKKLLGTAKPCQCSGQTAARPFKSAVGELLARC